MEKAKQNSNKSAAKSAKPRSASKQRDLVVVMILSLLLGLGGGYLLGTVATDNITNSTANSQMETTSSHMHGDLYEVPANKAPKVDLVVVEDAKSGYNIKIITTDFTFAPEKVNGENVVGEGHAHLYVDGEKIGRVYGEYYHYSGTFEGTKTFKVTLNANDHSEYAVDGEVIVAEVAVTHDGTDPAHDDVHMDNTSDPMSNEM